MKVISAPPVISPAATIRPPYQKIPARAENAKKLAVPANTARIIVRRTNNPNAVRIDPR